MTGDVPSWCASLAPSSSSDGLHNTVSVFLDALGLPTSHPLCVVGGSSFVSDAPLDVDDGSRDDRNVLSLPWLVTTYWQIAPALLAMAELWLRLFALVVAPVCLCHLLSSELRSSSSSSSSKRHKTVGASEKLACVVGLASASVVWTDSLYVLEFGTTYGAGLFGASLLLSTRSCLRARASTTAYLVAATATAIVLRTALCVLDRPPSSPVVDLGRELRVVEGGGGGTWAERQGHPPIHDGTGLDLPTFDPGFYYDTTNPTMQAVAEAWPAEDRLYEGKDATPWLVTGDARTGIPFLVNAAPSSPAYRVWVASNVKGEEEANAIDLFFPEDGIHRADRPLYLVLHGLNGGSNEEYVKDFTHRRRQEGSTVAVMIARGLMNTPVAGWNVFHGARVSDVDGAAAALRQALAPGQLLAGAGFSMGAIVLANYVARSGKDCRLDAAVSVSGGLDMREQLSFFRSMRLWQPMLADELRNTVLGQFRRRYEERLSKEEYLEFMRSSHISSIDRYAVVRYNGFEDLTHYYSEMSAMGVPGRIDNVAIPLLVVHALDDPLITWRTLGNPRDVSSSGNGFVMMLLTKSGGHVGWPLGMNPRVRAWEWMHTRVASFVNSVDTVRRAERELVRT